jgi:hypothetical protein
MEILGDKFMRIQTSILAIMLLFTAPAGASDIFKFDKYGFACFEKQDVDLVMRTAITDIDTGVELLNYMENMKRCIVARNEPLVRLVDIDGEYYEFYLLSVPGITLWTVKHNLKR